jgi:hypothetical protein
MSGYRCLEIFTIREDELAWLLRTGTTIHVRRGMPEGGQINAVHYNVERRTFEITVEHPSFWEVPPGAVIPRADEIRWTVESPDTPVSGFTTAWAWPETDE